LRKHTSYSDYMAFTPLLNSSTENKGAIAKCKTDNDKYVIKARNEIDDSFKWRTEDIFPSDQAWEKAFGDLNEDIKRFKEFKGKLGASSKVLLDYYLFQDEVDIKLTKVFCYSNLKKDQDTLETKYQDLYNRSYSLAVEFSTADAFATPEILAIPDETIEKFLAEEDGLKVYEHELRDLMRQRKYILSEKEESLIAKAGNVFHAPNDVFNMLTDADMTFPKILDEEGNETETSNSLYYKYRGSKHRSVRKANEEAYHGEFRKYRNTLSSLMRANIHRDTFNVKAREYDSCLAAALHGPNIPLKVYENLIKSVNDNIEPLHRYTALRKKILNINEVHGYDLYNSLFPDASMTVPFEEAKTLLLEGLKPLGDDYIYNLREGLEGGWLDVYENLGKRSGAYSMGVYGTHPYVLLNYHNRLDDAFTLAHEFGHSMHSFYSQKSQPKIYAGYTTFNAEIASTTNEVLLVNHLLKVTTEKEPRLFLLDFYLDSLRNTFFRQTLFAEFEWEIHKRSESNESLTADLLDDIYGSLVKKYYGPELVLDDYKAAEWSRIPHFYRGFYVYTYATGFSAAIAFADRILKSGADARRTYIDKFLSAGSRDYSTNILSDAGVDMTSSEPIIATARLFNSLLDELEILLNGK